MVTNQQMRINYALHDLPVEVSITVGCRKLSALLIYSVVLPSFTLVFLSFIYYTFQWDLVCDKNYLSEFSQTIYQSGSFFAQLSMGSVMDRFGRKPVHILANMALAVAGVGCAFTQTYIGFIATRIVVGFISQVNGVVTSFRS